MKNNEFNSMYVTGVTKNGEMTTPLNVPKDFDMNNKVTFRYVIEKNKKSTLLMNKEFTEFELQKSAICLNEFLLDITEGKNKFWSVDTRRLLNQIVELFNLRKFNLSLFNKMLKNLSKDNAIRWMFDNKNEVLIENAVNARFYMYLFEREKGSNVCTIHDKEFDLDSILEMSEEWENQPITKFEGFKSKQEFINWFKKSSHGTIQTKWSSESKKEMNIH